MHRSEFALSVSRLIGGYNLWNIIHMVSCFSLKVRISRVVVRTSIRAIINVFMGTHYHSILNIPNSII